MKILDLTDYAFNTAPVGLDEELRPRRPLPRRQRGRFLMGPVPMSWLLAAARLSGKALHVGVLLWHWRGWKKKNEFGFSGARCAQELGVNRSTVHRALRALERAHLVQVVWGTTRSPVVRLLDLEPEPKEPVLSAAEAARPHDEPGVEPRQPAAESGASPASDQSST